ncbi:hypothetical protein ACDX78_19620 [Virgibacillus oceani]
MKKKNDENQELKKIIKQKSLIKAPKEAHQKSLRTFQKGMETNKMTKPSNSKINRQLLASIATSAAVIGIMIVLLLDTDLFANNEPSSTPSPPAADVEEDVEEEIEEEVEENAEQSSQPIHLKDIGEDGEFINEVLERPIFDAMEYHPRYQSFDENQFVLDLPSNWSMEETTEEDNLNVHLSGDETEQIQIILFDEDQTNEAIIDYAEELLSSYNQTDQTIVPSSSIIEKITQEPLSFNRYEMLFPFNIEEAQVYAFKNEDIGRYYELFVAELFNRQMIYVSDLPLDNKDTWQTSWEMLASLAPEETPLLILDETEMHPTYDRPLQGEAIVAKGALSIDTVDLELYVNEELGMTSYFESTTETDKIDDDLYTEWRFYDKRYSDYSFYSYGMLKEGFPLDQGYQLIFETFDMDPATYEEMDGAIPYHYSYGNNANGNNYNGYIEFFEVEDSWYFVRVHEDYQDYNGGIFHERMRLLKNEAEYF